MKTILLTGATSGIGYEAAIILAKEGHHVVMVGRDRAKTERCVAEVKSKSGSSTVDFLLGDIGSQQSVRQLAADVLAKYPRLDVLVNNAGTVFEKRQLSVDGIEATWATNHLGGFLLTSLLLERLIASGPARIVMVSSVGHYRATLDLADVGFEKGGYGIMAAYTRSKLANVLMARSLVKRLDGKNVTVNSLHPGAVATNIWSGAPKWLQPPLALLKALFMISPEEGARTITYLATSPEVEGKTNLYFEKNQPKKPSRLARDEALAESVWQLSEQQTASR